MNPWLTQNAARMARERRAETLHHAGQILLTAAAAALVVTVTLTLIRAAAITGANLPHTLEQAAQL